ncbi:type I polyketide synthase [Streptomyces paromomycinus]|uniref:Hybrid non-ribosomal peptide synthetase/type I polyketide synthase n=1 Tax=Streptomyces paromomycinus TaxID=92743 RepID=A0A401VUP0_STREY|nr:type I polyketide synthase [Streptomyces paromomycinus]GCD40790.1 hybrid non-ribosomal peptide synthetase/type I polyketide synthase [Streptomyces paromomycinus]
MSDERAIAVVGLGLRAPGAADPEEFWRNLLAGTESVSALDDDDVVAAHGDATVLADPGLVRAGGILVGIEEFDAGYFGFTPREAELMDPQQRFLLEVAVEALEDAGCDPARCKDAIGVFLGIGRSGYFLHHLLPRTDLLASFARQISLFNDKDFAATQVSHRLGLTGPSMTIGTACSTSLVSVHQACRSLYDFECDVALAGGATINVLQRGGYTYQEGGIFSPDGHCRPFDADAQGTVGGSGVGLVVLKRLSDAVQDGDAIRAVIRGSAVNNDGADKVGFTAPSVRGQANVVYEAQQLAGVSADSIGYVEAHGTGTRLGDPIEVAALTEAFAASTSRRGFCALGSVKSSVGHLDSAAGIAGFIKAVLSVERGLIPPSPYFRKPNPEIDFSSGPFFVNAEVREWPEAPGGGPRRAGVSSFGMGGTNVHVIVEQPPAVDADTEPPAEHGWEVLVTSGKSAKALSGQRARLAEHLRREPAQPLSDAAFTLQTGRGQFEHRAAAVVRTAGDGATAFGPGHGVLTGVAGADVPVAFLFAGQGSQFPGMGQELHEREEVFREVFGQCARVAADELGEDLGSLVYGDTAEAAERLRETRVQQPALFAVQVAMAEQWRAWGVEPCAMLGHSLGEYVAATVAGVWSLPDAVRLVSARGELMQRQARGGMLVVSLGEEEAKRLAVAEGCVVAAVNSPGQVVLSGTQEAIDRAASVLAERGVRHRRLVTSHAFHSPLMEPMLAEFEARLAGVEMTAPRIPFLSNVTGEWITAEQAVSPAYWAGHVRAAVRFSDGAARLLADEPEALLLEVGPGTAASALVGAQEHARERVVVASMRHAMDARSDGQATREALARLWVNGAAVDWTALYHGRTPRRVPLPTYAFDTQRHWIERKPEGAAARTARLFRPVFRPAPLPAQATALVGERWLVFTDESGIGARWTARLRELGAHVVSVAAGSSYARTERDAFRIRPEAPEDFDTLVGALQTPPDAQETSEAAGVWNILYLWAIDTAADVDQARVVALDAPVHLARALGLHRSDHPTRLAVITRDLARVDGREQDDRTATPPTRALVLGPVKTLPLEYPSLTAAALDFEDAEADVRPAVDELAASLPDAFVAYRGGIRHAERVESTASPKVPDRAQEGTHQPGRSLRPQGVYLITGGLGGIGRAVAAWLARTYAARLVLTARTPLPPREQWAALEDDPAADAEVRHRVGAVRELEAAGAEVHVEAFDVADPVALGEAVTRAESQFGPIEGVIHAAGVAGGGLAQFQQAEAMRRVLAPKVDGTLALTSVFRDRSLEFFAVFSSTGALLGSLGQVDYCAANAFLDAWAESADAPEHAVAIAWDTWRGVGMASAERLPTAVLEAHAHHEPSGFTAADALAAIEPALFGGHPRVVVSTESLPGRLERGTKRHRNRQPEQAAEAAAAPEAQSRTDIENTLIDIWRNLFGRAQIDTHANFFELGGDSLLLIEAGRQIKERLHASLSVADLFSYPTIARLAGHLAPAPAAPQRAGAPVTAVRGTADDDAVAVIGMSARFPGARTVEDFWDNLVNGVESLVPTAEPPESAAGIGSRYVPVAGTPDGVDLFDPAFFGFTPREAELMDPQQRLLLMCAHEALEDSGYAPHEQPGQVAVYTGVSMSSYLLNNLVPHRSGERIDPTLVGLGNDKDFASSMISYRLNLRGPSVSVSTACSTSLVAIAHACRTLSSGECDMALAGGAKVRAPERSGYWHQEGGILSPDGHCRPFDADARGTVFSSGAGMVVLKRLSDALRDGDRVRAVIRGSAVNNDGADKVGFTAPSVRGQADVIAEAQRLAGVPADSIGYVEAHGTGTRLGDPIEVAALAEAFAASTSRRGFCALGSVKSNVGHLDSAAGIAGFIKAVLSVERGVIPPSLHFRKPNPEIDFASGPFFVNAEARQWPGTPGEEPRRAGVSSFGMGGTNAHVIVEQPPVPDTESSGPDEDGWQALITSAKSAAALSGQRTRLAGHLDRAPEQLLPDVAFTLQTGRGQYEHRAAAVVRTATEGAQVFADGDGLLTGVAGTNAPVAYVFAGQGSQYPGMGRKLYERENVFREVVEQCAEVAKEELGEDLCTLLYEEPEDESATRLAQTRLQQPALFAMQVAMAKQWRAWGVEPCAMLGHSLGEYVAATVAGVWSLPDAVRLVCARGELMQRQQRGSMLAVPLNEKEAARLADAEGCVVAAVNSPHQAALSGPEEAIDRAAGVLAERGVRHRRLATSHAFHSPLMAPMLAEFEERLVRVESKPPAVPFLSNITGEWITAEQATSPAYWAEHVRATVRFSDGAARLLADEPEALLLEVGPGTAAGALVGEQPQARERVLIASMRHRKDVRDDAQAAREALARLWVNGARVNWPALHKGRAPRRVPLPTYAFDTRRYWIEAPGRPTASADPQPAPRSTTAPPAQPRTTKAYPRPDLSTAYATPRSETETRIVSALEAALGVSPVGIHDDFFELGGSSLLALQVVARAGADFGVDLPGHAVLDAPTAARLAELVDAAPAPGRPAAVDGPRSLVLLNRGDDSRTPLFLLHPVGGSVYLYRELAHRLPSERPVYGFESAGLAAGTAPLRTVEEMAVRYLLELRATRPTGPYALGGSSFGGLVALEMAQRLTAAGEDVRLLTLFDTPGPGQMPPTGQPEADLSAFVPEVAEDTTIAYVRRVSDVYRANEEALHAYRPRPYPGSILYFLAEERREVIDPERPDSAWVPLARGGLTTHRVPGNHVTMLAPEHVAPLARIVADQLP